LDVVRVLRITQGAPAVEAVALRCQGVLEALRGRTEAARRMIAASRRMVEELGITHRLLEADVFAGRIELLEGDAAAAERCLRPAGATKPPPRRRARSSCGRPRAPRCLPSGPAAMVGVSPRSITRSVRCAPCAAACKRTPQAHTRLAWTLRLRPATATHSPRCSPTSWRSCTIPPALSTAGRDYSSRGAPCWRLET